MTITFEGRVAAVTGAGAGLGRAYALALAERGARVVVNDLGADARGKLGSDGAAQAVVDEIRAAGGHAVACVADVGDPAGGPAIVKGALEAFGRLDVLINNAGFLRDRSFAKSALEDFEAVCRVHLLGTAFCAHAAWPVMAAQGYGRILMTTSATGLYGNFGQAAYGAAKAGVVGLMHTLHIEGAKAGIRVNALAPLASTRLSEQTLPEAARTRFRPESVAGAALYLVSAAAPSGVTLSAGGGYAATVRTLEARGALIDTPTDPDAISEAWPAIEDHSAAVSFPDALGELRHIYAAARLDVGLG